MCLRKAEKRKKEALKRGDMLNAKEEMLIYHNRKDSQLKSATSKEQAEAVLLIREEEEQKLQLLIYQDKTIEHIIS